MKVVFISTGLVGPCLYDPCRPTEMVRYLPCDLVECYDEEQILANVGDADVVLVTWDLDFMPKGDWLSAVKESGAFVGSFYADVWHSQDIWSARAHTMGEEAHLVSYSAATKEHLPEFVDSMFWCPGNTDAHSYQVPRDIDILFWGWTAGARYPFRHFVRNQLLAWRAGDVKRVDRVLSMFDIAIKGRVYKCAIAASLGMAFYWHYMLKGDLAQNISGLQGNLSDGYYGRKLYRLISQAKIVCLGPPGGAPGVPTGKYFENAACGALQVTCEFTDRADLGFEHGKNIWITDEGHFEADLSYLLENPELVKDMARNAEELIHTRHTRMIRAQELYQFLCEKTGKT